MVVSAHKHKHINTMVKIGTKFGLLLCVTAVPIAADIVFGGEEIDLDQVFDLDYAIDSNQYIYTENHHKYYCVFRSNWNKVNHPVDYPDLAGWSDPIMFSHTKQYVPALKDRRAPIGVEQIAEPGFNNKMRSALVDAGDLVKNWTETKGFFVNQHNWDKNYVYLPPVKVDSEHHFLTGLSGMKPSPDWFTQFYLFQVFKQEGLTFWDSFKIRTYPWDAGTDDGTRYEDHDRDTDPPEFVHRLKKGNKDTEEGIFLSPGGGAVRHVAEWECVLHVCPPENPECEREDWPPPNGCDVLRFPNCANTCNPEIEECEQCRRDHKEEGDVFHHDCCLAGRRPQKRSRLSCDDPISSAGASTFRIVALATTALLLVAEYTL